MKTLLSLAVFALTSSQAFANLNQTLTCDVPKGIDSRVSVITIQDTDLKGQIAVETNYIKPDHASETVSRVSNNSVDSNKIFLFEETSGSQTTEHYLERENSDRHNFFTIASYRNGSLVKRTDAFYCSNRE